MSTDNTELQEPGKTKALYTYPQTLTDSKAKISASQIRPTPRARGLHYRSLEDLDRLLEEMILNEANKTRCSVAKNFQETERESTGFHRLTGAERAKKSEKLYFMKLRDKLRELEYHVGDDPCLEDISSHLREGINGIEEAAEDRATQERQKERERLRLKEENRLLKKMLLEQGAQPAPSKESVEALLSEIPLWKDRSNVDPGLDSLSWFDKYWKPHFDQGLVFQRELRRTDEPLYNALYGVCRRKGVPISDIIPPQQPRTAA